jgi:hypothetical protein
MSRPLRSTATPASSSFPAITSRSASERRDRYSMPSVSASARSLSRPLGPATPDDCFDARLLTFRARAADQDHAASTPGTTWPGHGHPPSSSQGMKQDPRFRCHLNLFDASTAHARPGLPGRALLERLPGPHLTRSTPRLFPERSPRRSSANAASGRFSACPRRTDAGGPTSLHLSHSTAYERCLLHDSSLSVRDTRFAGNTGPSDFPRSFIEGLPP